MSGYCFEYCLNVIRGFPRKALPRVLALAMVLLFWALCPASHAAQVDQPMLPSQAKSGNLPLLPYLDYYLDESGSMDIEEVASREMANAFNSFSLEKLPRKTGVLWLRFTLSPIAAQDRPPVFVLDMGPCVPGAARLYEPIKNELSGAVEWRELGPGNRGTMLLPEAGPEPVPCYLRLEGLPGIWFSPIARTPQDAAGNWGSLARSGAVLTLGVVFFLCLLRGVSERGQWRVWTALFVFFALIQAYAGLPPQVGNPGLWGLAGILSPGIALMLLPHVGRHLLRARAVSKSLDIQLFLLSLPGAALALLPLVPGWNWLDRWLDLWPLCTLIFLPTAMGAWLMGIPGARRFLLACFLPPVFTAAGVFGLYFGLPANLLASAPLWGIALAALLLATTRAPDYAQVEAKDDEGDKAADLVSDLPLPPNPGPEIINLETPLGDSIDDPNLRLIPPAALDLPLNDPLVEPNSRLVAKEAERSPAPRNTDDQREASLRAPLDDIMREGSALGHCSLPPAARKSAENMIAAAKKMAAMISGESGPDLGNQGGQGEQGDQAPKPELASFNLQRILRDAHDAVAPAAENAGIGLAWYMPPHMPQLYKGHVGQLGEILQRLLESSVRATTSGAVHLSAKRVPDSRDPGHILFTITDSGRGFPPVERSSIALDRAWELVGAHNGSISMDCGAQGATIAFSLHFTPLEGEEEARENHPQVMVLCENGDMRREIARMLEPLDIRLTECASPNELLRSQEEDPAGVLVVCGQYATPAASDMLHKFIFMARIGGFGACKIMAVNSDNSQDKLLAASGFTHAIPEPLQAEELRSTVLDLVEYVRAAYAPPKKAAEAPYETRMPAEDDAEDDQEYAQNHPWPGWADEDESAQDELAETAIPDDETVEAAAAETQGALEFGEADELEWDRESQFGSSFAEKPEDVEGIEEIEEIEEIEYEEQKLPEMPEQSVELDLADYEPEKTADLSPAQNAHNANNAHDATGAVNVENAEDVEDVEVVEVARQARNAQNAEIMAEKPNEPIQREVRDESAADAGPRKNLAHEELAQAELAQEDLDARAAKARPGEAWNNTPDDLTPRDDLNERPDDVIPAADREHMSDEQLPSGPQRPGNDLTPDLAEKLERDLEEVLDPELLESDSRPIGDFSEIERESEARLNAMARLAEDLRVGSLGGEEGLTSAKAYAAPQNQVQNTREEKLDQAEQHAANEEMSKPQMEHAPKTAADDSKAGISVGERPDQKEMLLEDEAPVSPAAEAARDGLVPENDNREKISAAETIVDVHIPENEPGLAADSHAQTLQDIVETRAEQVTESPQTIIVEPEPAATTVLTEPAASTSIPPVSPGTGVQSQVLADDGEWVGEPMPLGAKTQDQKREKSALAKILEKAGKSVPPKKEYAPEKRKPEMASPADAVEWVGEPMPIIKNDSRPRDTSTVAHENDRPAVDSGRFFREGMKTGQETGPASGAPETRPVAGTPETRPVASARETPPNAGAPENPRANASLGETRPDAKTRPGESAREETTNRLISDFVSKTISQVSSTFERMTRPRKEAGPEEMPKVENTEPVAPQKLHEPKIAQPENVAPKAPLPKKPERPKEESSAQKPRPFRFNSTNAGVEESADRSRDEQEMDPAIRILVEKLDRAIDEAKRAFAARNSQAVADCAGKIADESGQFGLRVLSRMATCVERAGRAGDMGALNDLLPELVAAVERNRITLTQIK